MKIIRLILPFLLLLIFLGNSSVKEGRIAISAIDGKRYISLYEIKRFFPIEASFDIILQRGKLYHKTHVAAYKVGHSYILADGNLYRDDLPVIRRQGDILLPVYLAGQILNLFYPEATIEDKGRELLISARTLPEDKIDDKPVPSTAAEPIGFIIVDAGHGGKDPGAIGKGGIREKDITLSVAKLLAAELKTKVKNIPIHLTRSTDRFLELYERTEFANSRLKKNVNGIFISVHVNASVSPKISGFETYFLSQNPSNEDARNTAALENNVIMFEEKSGPKKKYGEVEYIEARMITTQIQKESSMLAQSIQNGMNRNIKSFKSRGVRKADFYVLRGSLMPAVLVEIGFITHAEESKSLKQTSYQKLIANSIADGVSKFITDYNRMIK